MISAVTVYCSSSSKVDPIYLETAREIGQAIARAKWTLVYGGNYCGCMATLADGARAAGGKVIGVTPQRLVDKVKSDDLCDELIVTADMRQRKGLLESRGDAFVILPGGIGTFEEFFEILVGRTLGFHDKPIVLVNTAGFYDPMLAMLRHGVETHFIRSGVLELCHVAATAEDAIAYLKRFGGQP